MAKHRSQGFDFRSVFPRRRNMLAGSIGTIQWNSYHMKLGVEAETKWSQCCLARGVTVQAPHVKVETWGEEAMAVVARPVMEAGPDTLPVKYLDSGKSISIDLSLLFAVEPFPIVRNTRAYIPISLKDLPELGSALILHLGKAEFRSIRGSRHSDDIDAAVRQAAAAVDPGR